MPRSARDARDALDILLAVRRRALDDSRRMLVGALDAAGAAAAAVRQAELSIVTEMERASAPSGDDRLVEAFAVWLPGARQAAAQALTLQERQEAEVARCRADLAASRAALESIERLCAERAASAAQTAARHEAQGLDEAASRAKPAPD